MDSQQFREFGNACLDYLADYYDNIRDRPVQPSVKPGYLRPLIPENMPDEPESWQDMMKDMDRVIMPGITHWQAPGFHSYYPTGCSFPSMIGEMMSAGIGVEGFNWMASPACTELDNVMMDWMARAMGLPEEFHNASSSSGGGVFQGSASECTLMALLAAKEKTVRRLQEQHPDWTEQEIKAKLVSYASDQSNSSVEKAGMLASVPMRLLKPDKNGSLRGDTVEKAIKADIQKGLIPCYMAVNFGATPTCAFDKMEEIAPICQRYNVWVHLDAAYAGVAMICPELRHYMKGIHLADSIVTNLHKWFLVNNEASAMWVKSCKDIVEAFYVESMYLTDQNNTEKAQDLRNWQIPLGRRFRSMKVWFTLRAYGLKGLQEHIRNHVAFANQFEKSILADPRFELAAPTAMGLVCFRPKGDNKLSTAVIEELNKRKKVYMIPGKLFDTVCIRFVVCSPATTAEDIENSVKEVITATDIVMEQMKENTNTNTNKKENRISDDNSKKKETIIKPKNGIQVTNFVKHAHSDNCNIYPTRLLANFTLS